jgi:hypothetical protein
LDWKRWGREVTKKTIIRQIRKGRKFFTGSHEREGRVIMASRSLNVLKKLEKALNHKGSWPFLLRKNL